MSVGFVVVMLIVVIMCKWSEDGACCVVHDVRLYSVLDTVVMMFFVVWCLALWLVCLVVRVADDIYY